MFVLINFAMRVLNKISLCFSSKTISIFNATRKKVIPKYICNFRSIATMTNKMPRSKILITRGDIPSAGLSLLQEK